MSSYSDKDNMAKKWRIGNGQMHACVQTYKSETKVHIRWFELGDDDMWFPTRRGITLFWEEWEDLISKISLINSEFRRQSGQLVESVETRPPWYRRHGLGGLQVHPHLLPKINDPNKDIDPSKPDNANDISFDKKRKHDILDL